MNDVAGTGARAPTLRPDLQVIADLVAPRTRVLDIGCGDGALLDYLVHATGVDGRGIETSHAGVDACVTRGLSVIQGDADTDLRDYPSRSFDYVILSQTLQEMRRPREVLTELLRIGAHAIVSFPNFGHWRARAYLLRRGRMPVTRVLTYPWYATPNIHLCTIADFVSLCRELDAVIERRIVLDHRGNPGGFRANGAFSNLFGELAVFMLSARPSGGAGR
jgi:methionine biosynthesis protein MetW